jgi:hypothetical protein
MNTAAPLQGARMLLLDDNTLKKSWRRSYFVPFHMVAQVKELKQRADIIRYFSVGTASPICSESSRFTNPLAL